MKRNLFQVLAVTMGLALLVSACGKSGDTPTAANTSQTAQASNTAGTDKTEPKKDVTLVATTNYVGDQAKVLEEMFKAYSAANTNVKIDFSAPGKEYENMMKVKMASDDMPDLWTTHGWAKARYGNFLADLKDRPWASQIDPAFKSIIADESGKVYVLPVDEDKSMLVYNVDVFEKCGITEIPKTLDELLAACEQIKTKSGGKISPFTVSSEGWEEAQYFDYMASSLLISPEDSSKNFDKALLDGSFDWNNWTPLAEKWQEMSKKGYINKDALTAKYNDNTKAFAEGTAAMGWFGPYFIEEAKKVNPDLKADIMPIPAFNSDGRQSFAGGEKSTLGAWKDSKNLDAALSVIDYCALPENIKKMCDSTKLPSAILGVSVDLGQYTASFEKYKDIVTIPYFDRVWLPSGMWDVMCKSSQGIMAGKMTPQQFTDNMKKEYDRLRAAQE